MARSSRKRPKPDDFWQGIVRQIVTVIVTATLAAVGSYLKGLMEGEKERTTLKHELKETDDALNFALEYYTKP